MEIASPDTALSPAVRRLICGIGCDHCDQIRFDENESRSNANSGCLVSTVDLRLDQIAALLPAPDNTAEYFEKAVSALAPVFAQCQHALSSAATASNSDLQSILLSKLWWTQSQQVFCDFMEMMKTDLTACPENIISLLLVSAVLERSLGNVYLLKGSQCPSMLKDLLATEELADILGVSVVQMLRVVMGPPISLNLRNVAWHGFLADGELSNRYCCFLVLLAVSIGDLLSRKGIDKVPQRPYFTWTSEVQCKMLISSPSSEKVSNLQAIKDVLVESSLIQPQMDGQWQLIVSDLYPNDRCGYCLALLLPLLEHCLRRVFATVNSCPERVLTAESSAFYTTFSEMLEKTLPDGTTNKLPGFLTTPCMDLLQDLLIYPDGPRIRDHVSHGEIDFEAVDDKFVYPFVCFAVFLAHRLRPELPSFTANSCVQEMVQKIQFYRSVFHPVAILQQKFCGLLTLLDKTRDFVQVSADLELLGDGDGPSKLCEDNELFTRTQRELTSLWQCQPWAKACPVSKDDLDW
ncbi:hypothetical protein V1264_018232 [Littorina saxatilis]|uniref:DUF4209 domain-containing protein n=1 Tax=Littorina saxatilis TaxID=31220 RepID=A0AAN9BDM5_9CAEN